MTGRCVSCGSPFDLASYDGTGRCPKCREAPGQVALPNVPNHGPCAHCNQDVIHVYPWWTANPEKPGARPLHEECRVGYEGQEAAVAVREPQPVQVESSVSCRRKILRINAEHIVRAVYGSKTANCRVEGCTCLPEGFRVLSIHEQWRTHPQCIEVIVEHPSFDEVPWDQMLPVLHCSCRLNVVPLPPLN